MQYVFETSPSVVIETGAAGAQPFASSCFLTMLLVTLWVCIGKEFRNMAAALSLEFNMNGSRNYSSACSEAELTQGRNMMKLFSFLCATGHISPVTMEVDFFPSVAIIVLFITRFHVATRFLNIVSILHYPSFLNQ